MLNAFFKILIFASVLLQAANVRSEEQRYTYYENDGIFIYYETANTETYRQLLPEKFDMPDELLVYAFISDFYKMDARTEPYKEAALFLLAKHEGKEIWHCIFMPVTSHESRIAGIGRLGLPKIMGDISFQRNDTLFEAKAITEEGYEMSLKVNTDKYDFSDSEEASLKKLSVLPKLNLLDDKVMQMGRTSKRSVVELSKFFKNKLVLKAGVGEITLKGPTDNSSNVHPLNLQPSKILASYYLKNSVPFRLNGRPVK